jgi:polysaccharide biosynthesis protein PslG
MKFRPISRFVFLLRLLCLLFPCLAVIAGMSGCGINASYTQASAAKGSAGVHTPSSAIPPQYFGLHISNNAHWPSIPFGSRRLWDCGPTWATLEPQRGVFNWWILDQDLQDTEQSGSESILTLGMTPQWASSSPTISSYYGLGATAPPANIQDWRDYVTAVVTKYHGRIAAYEIWNEPMSTNFWIGTEVQLVQLTEEAYQIIHAIDPQAVVISPSANYQWMPGFLAAGGGNYVDVIGTHMSPTPAAPEQIVPIVEQMRSIMQQYGVQSKPLWNTEIEWTLPKNFDTDEEAAAWLARTYIVNWWLGIQREYFYAWDNRVYVTLWTVNANFQANAAGVAYGTVQRWLVGAVMQSCSSDADGTWTCALERNDKPFWIVWNVNGPHTIETASFGAATEEDISGKSENIAGQSTIGVDISPVMLQ